MIESLISNFITKESQRVHTSISCWENEVQVISEPKSKAQEGVMVT